MTSHTSEFATLVNVLFWRRLDTPISFSDRDMSRNVWNRLSCSSMVGTRILSNNIKSPYPECEILYVWNRLSCSSIVDTRVLSNSFKSHYPECKTLRMMTICSDTLDWSKLTLHLFLTLLLNMTLLPHLTFYSIARGFHKTFATGTHVREQLWIRYRVDIDSDAMLTKTFKLLCRYRSLMRIRATGMSSQRQVFLYTTKKKFRITYYIIFVHMTLKLYCR